MKVRAVAFAVLVVGAAGCPEHGSRPDVTNIDAGDEPTPPLPPPGGDDLARFSSCMTFEDFLASGMPSAWPLQADGGVSCISCHDAAGAVDLWPGVLAPEGFFAVISQRRKAMQLFFLADPEATPARRVIVNELRIPTIANGPAHPRFDTANGMAATRAFHDVAMARLVAAGGSCGPSKLID